MSSGLKLTNNSLEDGLKLTSHAEEEGRLNVDEAVGKFCTKYNVNQQFKSKLTQLQQYKIVVIADDSGSMRYNSGCGMEGVVSRWDELQIMCRMLIDLYASFDPSGMDLHFLNRDKIKGLKSSGDKRLADAFSQPPAGSTPICDELEKVLRNEIFLPRIIIIATDGVPTAKDGQSSEVPRLKQILTDRNAKLNYVCIVACTNDGKVLNYLNSWDVEINNLDVVDDYSSERTEVWRAQGFDFPFNYADYVVKLVLGGIDPYFDKLDEITAARRAQHQERQIQQGSFCCNIL